MPTFPPPLTQIWCAGSDRPPETIEFREGEARGPCPGCGEVFMLARVGIVPGHYRRVSIGISTAALMPAVAGLGCAVAAARQADEDRAGRRRVVLALVTETLARQQRRHWWQRRIPTIHFVPAAAAVVAALIEEGYIRTEAT